MAEKNPAGGSKRKPHPPEPISPEDRKRWGELTLTGEQIRNLASGEAEYCRKVTEELTKKMKEKGIFQEK